MSKLFVCLLPEKKRNETHGVDYVKGVNCGRKHEYVTRNCKPVFYTEEEVNVWGPGSIGEFIELTPFATNSPEESAIRV